MTGGHITQKNLNHPHKQLFDCSDYTDTNPWMYSGHDMESHMERWADWKADFLIRLFFILISIFQVVLCFHL